MKVTINGENMECSEGCTYRELAQQVQGAYAHRIVLAVADHKIRELFWMVKYGISMKLMRLEDVFFQKDLARTLHLLISGLPKIQ